MDYLARKLVGEGTLDTRAWGNIKLLLELWDSCVHFYHQSPAFRVRLQEIGAACAKNFTTAVRQWFERELSEFELHLMPLAFVDLPANMDGLLLNAEEKNFLNFLDGLESPEDDPASPYSVTVNIDVRFTRSKAKDALAVRPTNDPDAPHVHLTEEQVRERYPWDYQQLTDKCTERYEDFKINSDYHTIRKALLGDSRFANVRYLDPGNPKSSKKPFFNPNILNEMDKHYTKKS
jgi:hypothetical protein